MPKNLVIVESPAKAKTIQGYLGKDFSVESSFGHIADLPKKGMGIDIENNFKPEYKVTPDKKDVVKRLKSAASKAEMVWIASDEDREGEAIAWHLANELKLDKTNMKRIVFNEITKTAILKAIENPREINESLVNAQQARRILDRLVGFEVSPVLWRKVKAGLSAGRVQSVAVRLIAEREREIIAYQSSNYFRVTGLFVNEKNVKINAILNKRLEDEKQTKSFLQSIKAESKFWVDNVVVKPAVKKPAAPFTTSTLQQDASRKLGFSVGQTMSVAQKLYEAGYITYMRTDSVNLSNQAIGSAKNFIEKEFGNEYSQTRNFANKNKSAQEAHEAIRPTDFSRINGGIDSAQNRLYKLIWQRTVASQMAEAKLEKTTIKILNDANDFVFETKGEVILFDGFLKLYLESKDEDEEADEVEGLLPKLKKGDKLAYSNIVATEKFTNSPARFGEAALVQKLEELGIGRPSTYAPTISTIIKRNYVEKVIREAVQRKYKMLTLKQNQILEEVGIEMTGADKGKLSPTDIGMVVNDFLVENFPRVMDFGFTAKVEEEFDSIASGGHDWVEVIRSFYSDFHERVEDVNENADRASGERILGIHPKTKKEVLVRIGKFGPMVQMGKQDDEEKPTYASIPKDKSILSITFEEAIELFEFPKKLGETKDGDIVVNLGRFGPFISEGKLYASVPKDEDPFQMNFERALELINQKKEENRPIHVVDGIDVTKGKGRFGPYIKWGDLFINVNNKYDFDNLSIADIENLVEEKKQKEIDKVIHDWKEEGIRVEKARWGRSVILKGKIKIELSKDVDAKSLELDYVKELIEKKSPKKAEKKTAKKPAKKATQKASPKK